jgi:hypothetical protein
VVIIHGGKMKLYFRSRRTGNAVPPPSAVSTVENVLLEIDVT